MIDLKLPWPPSINHYYWHRGNHKIITNKGRAFREEVANIVSDAGCEKQEGNLALFIWVCPPDKRKRDLDNLVKATQDALQNAGCYDNDCQIKALHVEMDEVAKGGFIRVVIVTHRTVSQL